MFGEQKERDEIKQITEDVYDIIRYMICEYVIIDNIYIYICGYVYIYIYKYVVRRSYFK